MALTSPFGKYEYLKVPFKLAQTPVYFQELIKKVLRDLPFTIAYLNNITIYSKTAEHVDHLQQAFHKLCNAKVSMTLRKCHVIAMEIQYLAHLLSITGIKPIPLKTEAIKLKQPQRTPNKYELP